MIRQLGRPYRSFLLEEYGIQAIISEEAKRLVGSRIAA
jgi:hypothetical protein